MLDEKYHPGDCTEDLKKRNYELRNALPGLKFEDGERTHSQSPKCDFPSSDRKASHHDKNIQSKCEDYIDPRREMKI